MRKTDKRQGPTMPAKRENTRRAPLQTLLAITLLLLFSAAPRPLAQNVGDEPPGPPESYETLYEQVVNMLNAGQTAEAIPALKRMQELSPNDPFPPGVLGAIHRSHGFEHHEKGEYDRAIEDYDKALLLDSNDVIALYNRGLARYQKGAYHKAIRDYNRVLQLGPQDATAHNSRAAAYENMGEQARAIEDYTRAIQLDSGYANAWSNRGSLQDKRGEHNRAIEDFTQAIKHDPNNAAACNGRGIAHHKIGGHHRAIEDYTRAIHIDPNYAAAYNNRGKAYDAKGDPERAIAEYTQAIRLDPKNLTAHGNRAITHIAIGDYDSALQDMELARNRGFLEQRKTKPASLAQIRERCGKDEAVLRYIIWDSQIDYTPAKPGPNKTAAAYCLIITKDGATQVPLSPNFDYAGAISRLREEITMKSNIRYNRINSIEDDRNALHNTLVKPVLPHLPKNIKNLVIVPDGPLSRLPFDILRESSRGKDLGETYRLSFSPSLPASAPRDRNNGRNLPVAAFGDVWYSTKKTLAERLLGVPLRGNPGSKTPIKTGKDCPDRPIPADLPWEDLGCSRPTVENLSRFVPQPQNKNIKMFLGSDASEENIKKLSKEGELAKYPVIHFSIHGHLPAEDRVETGKPTSIVLSEVSGLLENGEDGYLTIPEIAALNLNARMVTLSACYSGLEEFSPGNGMTSLPRAFMAAGAENVGTGLWELHDEAALVFWTGVYKKVLRKGKTFGEAYYLTKKEFRRDKRWSFPFYWAPFVIYE